MKRRGPQDDRAVDRNPSSPRRRVKESLARLLATTAGTMLVASAAGGPPGAQASVAPPAAPAVTERARELRQTVSAPQDRRAEEAPVQLAWWGNWHNGGWHPYWHNWPNWRNWHNWPNWHNWGNY